MIARKAQLLKLTYFYVPRVITDNCVETRILREFKRRVCEPSPVTGRDQQLVTRGCDLSCLNRLRGTI